MNASLGGEAPKFMHRVMPMKIRLLFTLHKVRTIIWKGGGALMGNFVNSDAVLADKRMMPMRGGGENLKKRGVRP
nr:hypothetical protein [Holospora obtusa]